VHGKPDFDTLTFDCYGTLIDWEGGISSAFICEAARDGVTLDRDAVLAAHAEVEPQVQARDFRLYREVLTEVAVRVGERLGWPVSSERARFLPNGLPDWTPFDDTNPALERLRKRFRLGILSNIDDDLLAGTRKHLTVDFDWTVTAEQVRSYKPAAGHFEAGIRRAGGAGRILHVGASIFHDVRPAKRHGLQVSFVNRNAEPVPEDARPDLVVRDLLELADQIGA
jgi:2-haloalkanoic acid dehalogenase type II